MPKYLVMDNTDPDYGKTCRQCGGKKSLLAAMCMACRSKVKQASALFPVVTYELGLEQHWPMPIPFPPVVSQPARVHLYERWEPGE